MDTEVIIVNSEVDPTINPQPDICESVGTINLTSLNPGGIWAGAGIINPTTGLFDPSFFGPGSYTVVYAIPGFCPTADSISFNVIADEIPSIVFPGMYCSGDIVDTLFADLSGGIWSGPGITNPTVGTFIRLLQLLE